MMHFCFLAIYLLVGDIHIHFHDPHVHAFANASQFMQTKSSEKSSNLLLINTIIFPAVAPKCMRNPWVGEEEGSSGNTNTSGGANKMEEPWAGLSERSLVTMVEQLFTHLLKVLNICAHVMDDTPPGPAVKVTSLCFVGSLPERLLLSNIYRYLICYN